MYLINYGMLPFITLLLYKSSPSPDGTRTQRCLPNERTMSDEEPQDRYYTSYVPLDPIWSG